MTRLTPGDIIRIRRELQIKALVDLRRGKMQSVRLLIGHDDLGPTLSTDDLTEKLLNEAAEARQPREEIPYDW